MSCKLILVFILFLVNIFSPAYLKAEIDATRSTFGFATGPFLPSQMPGLIEVMQLSGLRYSVPIFLGRVELEAVYGHITHNKLGSLSGRLRYDLDFQGMPVLFLLGADVVSYTQVNRVRTLTLIGSEIVNEEYRLIKSGPAQMASGHIGFSLYPEIWQDYRFRADSILRFSGSMSLYFSMGIEHVF